MKRELALAIVLWKQVRMTNKMETLEQTLGHLSQDSFDAAMFSIDLAKFAGLTTQEYMDAVDQVPIHSIQVKSLDRWDRDESAKVPFARYKTKKNGKE